MIACSLKKVGTQRVLKLKITMTLKNRGNDDCIESTLTKNSKAISARFIIHHFEDM